MRLHISSALEKNRFGEHSDVDIAFLRLGRDELFYVTGYISREIGRDVNIIHLEDISFKDKILREWFQMEKRVNIFVAELEAQQKEIFKHHSAIQEKSKRREVSIGTAKRFAFLIFIY